MLEGFEGVGKGHATSMGSPFLMPYRWDCKFPVCCWVIGEWAWKE
jgi:hypothetical protein